MPRLPLLLTLGLVTGCDAGPRAPALVTETVFADPAAGVTFVTPDGWAIAGRSTLPAGPLSRPIRLVSYFRPGGKVRAEFDVYVADLPAGADVLAYLASHPFGAEKWTAAGPPTPAAPGGTRYAYTAPRGKQTARREVVAVPRSGRHLLFVTTAPADDPAFDQTRPAVQSALTGG